MNAEYKPKGNSLEMYVSYRKHNVAIDFFCKLSMFYESTKLKQYKNYDATLEWISLHCDVHCVPNIKRCILCVRIITYCYLEPSQNKKGQKNFLATPFLFLFSQLPAVKKRNKKWCS